MGPDASGKTAWRALVDKALKGKSFEAALTTPLPEGLILAPLYTEAEATGVAAVMGHGPWDIRQAFAHPDLRQCNQEILTDLENGVTSLLLRFDQAAWLGYDADAPEAADLAGRGGIMIATADDLDTVLAGVDLDIAAVALDAGAGSVAAAALLSEVWRKRGAMASGAFNIDPFRTLAVSGWLPGGLEEALADMAAVAVRTAAAFPGVTTVGVDTTALHAAGADEALDLGAALATGVAYLRALTTAGLSIDEAARQIAYTLAVDTDLYLSMAKLRAARLLWARVLEASGASHRRMTLTATVSARVLSQRDPWVNLLRVTLGAFAAATAGADGITAPAFDEALGLSTSFARRLARNTQILLAEEANLARVADPAAGSWAIESLTAQLAERAWAEFQGIERAGGMAAVLLSGALRERLAAAWGDRQRAVARRQEPVLGVSDFPNLGEEPVEVARPDLETLRRGAIARLKRVRRGEPVASLDEVFMTAGISTIGRLAAGRGGEPLALPRIVPHRLGEDFEALRDASDIAMVLEGQRPSVYLHTLGPLAEHSARLGFARAAFEAGGIAAITAGSFADSGAAIACLCGADARYAEEAATAATALKEAGARRVYLAGKPGSEKPSGYAGVDEYLYSGCDLITLLRATHHLLGVG